MNPEQQVHFPQATASNRDIFELALKSALQLVLALATTTSPFEDWILPDVFAICHQPLVIRNYAILEQRFDPESIPSEHAFSYYVRLYYSGIIRSLSNESIPLQGHYPEDTRRL
jgi:hypothetical protein